LAKDPIIVYWASEESIEREHQQVLLDLKPVSVMSDLQKRKSKTLLTRSTNSADKMDVLANGYHMCSALHELIDNMYYIKAPFSAKVDFNEDGMVDRTQYFSSWFRERHTSTEGAFAADFELSYSLFCEESLEVKFTPPYLHQTSQPEYGFICSTKVNIGKWYRPFVLIYQLWPGKKSIYFNQDDPLAYFEFDTDRPVVLKEFRITPTIVEIQNACLRHKTILHFEKMQRLYDRFTKTSMRQRLLDEIKKNVIE
jgi:hypothetical protein